MSDIQSPEEEVGLARQPGGAVALVSWRDAAGATRIASGGDDGTIRIWDPGNGTQLMEPLIGHTAGLWALTCWTGADGRSRIASTGDDGVIRVWDAETGAEISPPLLEQTSGVWALTTWTGPDGKTRIASADDDGVIRVWDPETGTEPADPLLGHTAGIWALASWISADEKAMLASAGDDGTIRIWDLESGTEVSRLPHEGRVLALAAWTDGEGCPRLASAGDRGLVHIWDAGTGTHVGEALNADRGWVLGLVPLAPVGGPHLLAAANYDGTVSLWDTDSGIPYGEPLTGHTSGVVALTTWVASDAGLRVASASDDGSVRIWDPLTGAPVGRPLFGHSAGVLSLTVWTAPDGQGHRIASASSDGVVRVWDPDRGLMEGDPLIGHTGWLRAVVSLADERVRLVSASYDGGIRVWDLGTGASLPVADGGHPGGVLALAVWKGRSGARLASGGYDGTIRVWDLDTGTATGVAPMTGHVGGVTALTVLPREDAASLLVSAGYDGTIRVWDPETGDSAGGPIAAHTGRVWAAIPWTASDGAVRLASTGDDGTVRMWDLGTGEPYGRTLDGHQHGGRALVHWTGPDGARLAVACGDGTIVVWDPEAAVQTVPPMAGHALLVWAMVGWSTPDGHRLASGSSDGTIRLWDPERGVALRSVEVGAVTLWGLTDAPATRDLLGRDTFADALARQIHRTDPQARTDPGPMVVTLEGPWGCGKSTLMQLVRARLPPATSGPSRRSRRRFTVRQAIKIINSQDSGQSEPDSPAPTRGVITAWFNPWAYQSGGQIWAGLAEAVIEAAEPLLYPSEAERARYWFTRNIRRVDRYALLRSIRRRIISPILGVWLAAALVQVGVGLVGVNSKITILNHEINTVLLAVGISFLAAFAGLAHTAIRYFRSPASSYIGADLLNGPVNADPSSATQEPDPLWQASTGPLYLNQHDIHGLVRDLADQGCELVVFVDDLDRCRTDTVAEVFQAINLFLSGFTAHGGLRGRFVLGLDPEVVAAHISHGQDLATSHGDDPSIGWAYLRKLIQLPVRVPSVTDDGLHSFVEAVTGPAEPVSASAVSPRHSPPPIATASAPRPVAQPASVPSPRPAPEAGGGRRRPRPRVETVPWRSLEQHPEVRALIRQRLAAQPERSIREAKRLLNVWQLYERVLAGVDPLSDTSAAITRARDLVILAEIITRWPALQTALNHRFDGRRGLALLADALPDETRWASAVELIGLAGDEHRRALAGLKTLLSDHEAVRIARIADRLL